jgi:hypothetical protein
MGPWLEVAGLGEAPKHTCVKQQGAIAPAGKTNRDVVFDRFAGVGREVDDRGSGQLPVDRAVVVVGHLDSPGFRTEI